ncbi:MAG: hypothetical protein BWK80_37935 [Desulfobacteraceae bacterium IS3]|nr:MAG: hypothetical protein BWK80_37935 [Desulfobacteraceae bacterium IS3]
MSDYSLKIGMLERGRGICPVEEKSVRMNRIEIRWQQIVEKINQANRPVSRGKPDLSEELKKMGQELWEEFLTPDIREKLLTAKAQYLMLEIDANLVHIPWELIYINGEFLCQRFKVGRLPSTRQKSRSYENRELKPPLNMWILSNPGNDLTAADQEGEMICEYMDQISLEEPPVYADLYSDVSPDEVKEKIKHYDIVHFAGHADYNEQNPEQSGWRLKGGNFTAQDIDEIAGGNPMPALVFSNACQSARTDKWDHSVERSGDVSFGLANAFMLAGVRHYIGSSWEIKDEPSRNFACLFYEHLVSGKTVGEAVHQARLDLMKKDQSGNDISWASYVLYGDPTFSYFGQNESEGCIELKVTGIDLPPKPAAASQPLPSHDWKRYQKIAAVAGGLLIMGAVFFMPKEGVLDQVKNKVIQIQNETKGLVGLPPADDWSSQRLTIAVLYDKNKGDFRVSNGLQKSLLEKCPRMNLLDREKLDEIIKEFELSQGKWVQLKNKLTPDLLTVKLFLFIEQVDGEIIMRLDDTVTGRTIDFFQAILESGKSPYLQKDKLSEELLTKLKEHCSPIRGKISKKTDKNLELNIGTDVGVDTGQQFRVVETGTILEIESVKESSSFATVKKGEMPEEGDKIEEVSEPSSGLKAKN